MLTDLELDHHLATLGTPTPGRQLVRKMRKDGPARALQNLHDCVRVRHISKKMNGRALYGQSRTVEYPAIYMHEHDPEVLEIWPQPCTVDMVDPERRTRLQHTPDIFLVTEEGLVMEEWREEKRLLKLAASRPQHFYKDSDGTWHYEPAERHFKGLGITYRLRSADELPRRYLANLHFVEDYTSETTPVVPAAERRRLKALLADQPRVPLMDLLVEHGFAADHVYQLVLDQSAYVDLYETVLAKSIDLVIYRDKVACDADAIFAAQNNLVELPSNALVLTEGTEFLFDGKQFSVELVGEQHIVAKGADGNCRTLPLELVQQLHQQNMVVARQAQTIAPEYDVDELINARALGGALERLEHLNNPDMPGKSARSVSRYKAKTRGMTTVQEKLRALMSQNPGNTKSKLPEAAITLAKKVVAEHHNTTSKPTKWSSLVVYRNRCHAEGVVPMGKTSFYKWITGKENVAAREGRRMEYQKKAIPLVFDYHHPVHGVLPHEVCYIDHTILNIFLGGREVADLGKPTLTLATDGALSLTRAFYLSFRPASTESVMMVLRDYVRRHGRLPKVIVLDNGKEFHSTALKLFCSAYGIDIRYRRRSKPRDSSLVERSLGATETEVLQQLEGNSIALKNPRMVSSSHLPQKHIRWSLTPLHGALQHYFFHTHENRPHRRFGMSPVEKEKQLKFEMGARSHIFVNYNSLFRLLTAPHSGSPTRVLDRQRGVYVDGRHYWHERLAMGYAQEKCEVRREPWRARVVYVKFRGEWLIAQARDGGTLEGRYLREEEIQAREEQLRKVNMAQQGRLSLDHTQSLAKVYDIKNWDPKLREQMDQEYALYAPLKMCEALEEAKNPHGGQATVPAPRAASVELAMAEPDDRPDWEDEEERASSPGSTLLNSHATEPLVATPAASAVVSEDDFF